MLIVDSQIHVWTNGKMIAHHRQDATYSYEDALAEMKTAGVDGAVIHPPGSIGEHMNAYAIEAVQHHPDRFCILGNFNLQLLDTAGGQYLPQTGELVELTFGATTIRMVVPAVSIDWNAATDRVFGEATSGGNVAVVARPPAGAGNGQVNLNMDVGTVGSYDLDFAGQSDIRPGSRLEVTYSYPNGNRARIDRAVPFLNVQVGGNVVFGLALPITMSEDTRTPSAFVYLSYELPFKR